MVTKTYGSALHGTKARTLTIAISKGSGSGLPREKESLNRIAASLKLLGMEIPPGVMINFTPSGPMADICSLQLPVALGMIAFEGQEFPEPLQDYVIVGALSEQGQTKPVRGVLPIAIQTRKEGFKGIVVPQDNASEAAIVNNLTVIGIRNLQEAVAFFKGEHSVRPLVQDTRDLFYRQLNGYNTDFSQVPGYRHVKRAMEIAAAGGHHVLMIGPPGGGKSELARRFPTILPPLTLHEALDTTKIYSLAGKLDPGASLIAARPFRRLHHTISIDEVTGSGNLPGEASLSHNGVLFLEELPEFKNAVPQGIDPLLESRKVTLTQDSFSSEFPASFILLASMNPCPCGYYNHRVKTCSCSFEVMQRYLGTVTHPLDQIDLQVETDPSDDEVETSSEEIRERVAEARKIQSQRFGQGIFNAMMSSPMILEACRIAPAGKALLKRAMEKSGLPESSGDRILKVSRTIADLEGSKEIGIQHLAEALGYRSLDKLKAQLR